MAEPSDTHSPLEDAVALITGTALVSLAIALHSHVSILTGGTAGLALLLQYSAGVPFGLGFFVINLPFYALAILRLGWPLALRTVVGVTLVSVLARLTPDWLAIREINPVYSAIIGGVLLGVGLLILFRHRISLGGINLLAIYAQERLGLSAGWVQLGVDVLILLLALWFLPLEKVGLSLLAAAVLNIILAVNHKPGRYTARS